MLKTSFFDVSEMFPWKIRKLLRMRSGDGPCEKKNVDKIIDMGHKSHMNIGKVLLDLIAKEGISFRRTSIDLGVDRSTLYRSLKKGNPEWKTIEKVLDYLGYQIIIVQKKKRSKRIS